MNDRSDADLVLACKRGQKSAFALLVKKHYKHVFAVCLGMLGNVSDAEDIAQDTMLKAFLNINRLRENEQFGAWLLRMARNLCIDLLRRKRHVKTILAGHVMPGKDNGDEFHNLQQCIGHLPMEFRLPLVMYYFDNKNAKTIAEKLNISHSGVCTKIREAKNLLHKLLTERGKK